MKKKVLSNLDKCYAIAPLTYQGKQHILVAAEKTDRCILFDARGNEVDTVWEGPGGVMTMVQVPGTDGQFLSTQKFYSPNDSREAKIVIATPKNGKWEIRTLVDLPFVHRFDILQKNGRKYLIACALKSDHEYKNDWRFPGKVYGAVLPEDLSGFDEEHQLELTVLKDNMLKNHGYCHIDDAEGDSSLICSANGVFRFYPPAEIDGQWRIEKLLDTPASDALLVDFDEDGKDELLVMSPFHGDTIYIYRQKDGGYELDYEYPEKLEFLHAIWGCKLQGKPTAIIGYRKGDRDLLKITWENGAYQIEMLDHDCGPANVYGFARDGQDVLVATNREINEVAMYEFS